MDVSVVSLLCVLLAALAASAALVSARRRLAGENAALRARLAAREAAEAEAWGLLREASANVGAEVERSREAAELQRARVEETRAELEAARAEAARLREEIAKTSQRAEEEKAGFTAEIERLRGEIAKTDQRAEERVAALRAEAAQAGVVRAKMEAEGRAASEGAFGRERALRDELAASEGRAEELSRALRERLAASEERAEELSRALGERLAASEGRIEELSRALRSAEEEAFRATTEKDAFAVEVRALRDELKRRDAKAAEEAALASRPPAPVRVAAKSAKVPDPIVTFFCTVCGEGGTGTKPHRCLVEEKELADKARVAGKR